MEREGRRERERGGVCVWSVFVTGPEGTDGPGAKVKAISVLAGPQIDFKHLKFPEKNVAVCIQSSGVAFKDNGND